MVFFGKKKNNKPEPTRNSSKSATTATLETNTGNVNNSFGSEALLNSHSAELRRNETIDCSYAGYFVFSGDIDENIHDDQKLKELIGGNTDLVIGLQENKSTIHPFYGEVTLSSVSYEDVPFPSVGNINKVYFIVMKGNELRRICHAKCSKDLKEQATELEWKIHHDIEQRGWNCVQQKEGRWEFSHLGRDEEWMNHKHEKEYIEQVEPIVEKCINSSCEVLSVLGAYNLQNILVYLPVQDLNNCYKSFQIMRELISCRDFLYRVIESQCVTLPNFYYQQSQRNLRHCTMLDLLKLYHERRELYSMGRKHPGSYVIWLNETYWSTKTNHESEFGKTIELSSVWWFDFGATLTLKRGSYNISLRYKTHSPTGLNGKTFTISLSAGNDFVGEITSDPYCSFKSSDWTFMSLGKVKVDSPNAYIILQIHDHNNTYKSGLEIDCFKFERI